MTQIKIFTETTYENGGPNVQTDEDLTKKVNEFLSNNDGKIIVKDIKYSIQSPNPHQIYNLSVKYWTIMIIYDTI